MTAIYSQDPQFCFESKIRESLAVEHLGDQDLGPTDNLPPDELDLEYRAFFGADSPLTSPCPSRSPSRSSSRSASPHRADSAPPSAGGPENPAPSSPTSAPPRKPQNSNKKRNKARAHKKRTRERVAEREASHSRPVKINEDAAKKCSDGAAPTETTYDSKSFPASSTGFTSRPDHHETHRTYTLKQFTDDLGFKLQCWDGKTPMPILDAQGRIIAVPAGHPNDPTWKNVHRDAATVIRRFAEECHFPQKSRVHRRGKFSVLNWGISHGGGQKKPGNLYHSARNRRALTTLKEDKNIARIAQYSNKAFALWAPNLYTYYESHFDPLLDQDHTLRRNWPNNVWASFAVNFGPKTVCDSHRDFANLPFGWCAITALGDFDPKKGGHLVLWELKLVIEFPPGSTILIPSSAITHSNVPIGRRETRYSFTQFSAGGLFRWVDQGFQCTPNFKAKLTKQQREEEIGRQEERCKLGLSLFSTMSSLSADQAARNLLIESRCVEA